jgi:hypothetical protein
MFVCRRNAVQFVLYAVKGVLDYSEYKLQFSNTAVIAVSASERISGHIFVMSHEGKGSSYARVYAAFGLVLCLRYETYGNKRNYRK